MNDFVGAHYDDGYAAPNNIKRRPRAVIPHPSDLRLIIAIDVESPAQYTQAHENVNGKYIGEKSHSTIVYFMDREEMLDKSKT